MCGQKLSRLGSSSGGSDRFGTGLAAEVCTSCGISQPGGACWHQHYHSPTAIMAQIVWQRIASQLRSAGMHNFFTLLCTQCHLISGSTSQLVDAAAFFCGGTCAYKPLTNMYACVQSWPAYHLTHSARHLACPQMECHPPLCALSSTANPVKRARVLSATRHRQQRQPRQALPQERQRRPVLQPPRLRQRGNSLCLKAS